MKSKSYTVAVVGESMTGKSTWIANLFDEKTTGLLKSLYEINKEGQTKIATHYILNTEEVTELELSNISWNKENLNDLDENKHKIIKMIFGYLGVLDSFNENDVVESTDNIKNALKNANPIESLKNIVNNKEILESGLIEHVEITGNADSKVKELLSKYKVESLCIIDTRGFLDETLDSVLEQLQNNDMAENKKEYENCEYKKSCTTEDGIQKLLDDRGLHVVDAVVFMSMAGSNALNKELSREIYGPLIQELLRKHPTFLTIRTDRLTEKLNNGQNYLEECNRLLENERFTGFNNIEKLLRDYGLFNSSDYKSAVAHKHYKKLVLADISENRINEDAGIYRKSAVGVLEEVIKGVLDYYKDLEQATACYNSIMQLDEYKKLFDEYFDDKVYLQDTKCVSKLHKYYPWYLAKKIQSGYTNGLVGKKGGLTTYISGRGYVGDAAIDLMENAYNTKKYINDKLVDNLKEKIIEYCKTVSVNDDIDDTVLSMQQKITDKLQFDLERNFERLSITGRMIPRCYLELAYKDTCNELKVDSQHIGECLEEYKTRYTIPEWDRERYFISVVKHITWKMIEKTFSTNTEVDGVNFNED